MTQSLNVVIATFRRPDRLSKALQSLVEAAAAAGPEWTVGVTVVDDDSSGSARVVTVDFDARFAAGCAYLSCGAANISKARNMGLESALSRADWIGSIDDDVTVPRDWVRVCAESLARGNFNAVTGPLLKDFSNGPAWLTVEPFDQMGILVGQDGQPAFTCATGNNWVSADFLNSQPHLRFNPELGESGGEDMDFFYRSIAAGLRPVFSVEAAVTEREPADRCTMRYQLRRAYWLGLSEAQINMRLHKASRPRLVVRACRRVLNGGAGQLPADRLAQRGWRYRSAVIAQSVGLITGSFGFALDHK